MLRTVELANTSFGEGDFERTCSYYSAEIQRQLALDAEVKTCPEAWAAIDAGLRRTLSPSEFDDLIGYNAESADVEGDTATARYGEPPESIGDRLELRNGAIAELRRDGEAWVVTGLPE